MSLQSIAVPLFFAIMVLSQGERATLPLTLQPRPLKGGCSSQDEISEIHDEVRAIIQDTVEPIRRQAAQELNGTNSSDSNGDTQHCFSGEHWNKLQDDIKEGIYTELQGELDKLESELIQNITQLYNGIIQVQIDLNQTESKLNDDITQLETKLIELPSSCKELAERIPVLPSGYYSIYNINDTILSTYCDMTIQGCGNGTGGWTRVAYLGMTKPFHHCPSEWREIMSPIWTCGKSTNFAGCNSATFRTNGLQYSKILGRLVAYQYGSPDVFSDGASQTLEGHYLDGVSITNGMPRNHIWSLAADWRDNYVYCPCSTAYTAPSFVKDDYFCGSGNTASSWDHVFYDEPIWDGQGCGTNTCCTYNNPPWFCKQLPQATTDDIEIRLCDDEGYSNEDTPIELIEIYVQ